MSSDGESINEWTLDEIDLDKPLVDLHTLLDDRTALNDALFEHLNQKELHQIFAKPNDVVSASLDHLFVFELTQSVLKVLSVRQ